MTTGVLYWITGLSGSGKTTIGTELYYQLRKEHDNVVLLDGDILKRVAGSNTGYSLEERHERAGLYARICRMLTDQRMIVICCTIAMFDDIRAYNRKNNKAYVEVFLDVPYEVLELRDQKGMYSGYKKGEFSNLAGGDLSVEFPQNPDITIINDGRFTVRDCVNMIMQFPVLGSDEFKRDTEYWNSYYSKGGVEEPSLFAQYVLKNMERSIENRSVIDLGCGNGRDSFYFASKGLNVTAIDASEKAIETIGNKARSMDNLRALCDDFVCAQALFMGQYDYCYSRFSLHAITDDQETELFDNIYNCLKTNGSFFIEVRSIHDPLYGKGKLIGRNTYLYDDHFRRFVDINELCDKLKKTGFTIAYAEESEGFAPFDSCDPPIIRVTAKKLIQK